MNGLVHPFTQALYEKTADGNILVTDGDEQGVFSRDGRWIEGELFECDPQLCGWVAGPRVTNLRLAPTSDE